MPSHQETQISPYTSEQLYTMVADIERYPEFLPWCRAARILEKNPSHMLGELMICFKHFCESYTSRISLVPPTDPHASAAINVEMVKGPFEYLKNTWEFTPLTTGGTKIDFFIDFKFRSKLLDAMLGGFFSRATEKMADAFTKRADILYGK